MTTSDDNNNPQIYTVKIFEDGRKYWLQNDQLHRKDGGPAVEFANGTKMWYKNNQPHRTDGPAIEWANGEKSWYIDGEKLTEQEFNNRRTNKINSCDGKIVEIDGKKYTLTLVK